MKTMNIHFITNFHSEVWNSFLFPHNNKSANTGDLTKVNRESVQFLFKSTELGTEMYRKYYETRLEQKSAKLFDNIPKIRKTTKVRDDTQKYHLNKENVNFLRKIHYPRLINYNIKHLLTTSEFVPTSFFLTEDGYLRKSQKAELTTEKTTQRKLSSYTSTHWIETNDCQWFHEYAKKVPVKKQKWKLSITWIRVRGQLSKPYQQHAHGWTVFYLYRESSINTHERDRLIKI